MIDRNCSIICETLNFLGRCNGLRNFLQNCDSNLTHSTPKERLVERIAEFFFDGNREPIKVFYWFLHRTRDNIRDPMVLRDLVVFRNLCLIKSMPKDLHSSYVAAFSERSEEIRSQTENRYLIALQLAAAALTVFPSNDAANSDAYFVPSAGFGHAIELRADHWESPFEDRACDHVFMFGEPPFEGIVNHNTQLKYFIDGLISCMKIDSALDENEDVKTDLIRRLLEEDRENGKYYVAVLPERNDDLIKALLANEDLNLLIVVSCPEFTCNNLAVLKRRIDQVNKILREVYMEVNS